MNVIRVPIVSFTIACLTSSIMPAVMILLPMMSAHPPPPRERLRETEELTANGGPSTPQVRCKVTQ